MARRRQIAGGQRGSMASFGTLTVIARLAYYSKSIVAMVCALVLEKRHVAVFVHIRHRGMTPEFLQIHHKEWGCFMLPGAQLNPDRRSGQVLEERWIAKLQATPASGLNPTDFTFERLEGCDLASVKRSGSDMRRRVYFFVFYLVRSRNEAKNQLVERLVEQSAHTRWASYNDMRNDRMSYEKDWDVIDHIGAVLNKGVGVLPNSSFARQLSDDPEKKLLGPQRD